MARIRTIKPEFWADEKLGNLGPLSRLVFLGLVSQADDAGRLIDSPRLINGLLFPFTDDDCTESLAELAALGVIERGATASGQPIIQVAGWERHQKIDRPNLRASLGAIPDTSAKRRRKPADKPQSERQPLGEGSAEDQRDFDDDSTNVRRRLDECSSKDRRGLDEVSSSGSTTYDLRSTTNDQRAATDELRPARAARRETEVLEAVAQECPEFRSDFEQAFRASHAPEALAAEMLVQREGLNLPAGLQATWPVLGQALRDIALSGDRLTANRLRVFVASLLRGDTTRERPPARGTPAQPLDPLDDWHYTPEVSSA